MEDNDKHYKAHLCTFIGISLVLRARLSRRKNVRSQLTGLHGTDYRGIQKRDVMAKVMRNTITLSIQPFYNVDDQQKMFFLCRLLATVKHMYPANPFSFL